MRQQTLLHIAVASGHLSIVEYLTVGPGSTDAHLLINEKDTSGNTPFDIAVGSDDFRRMACCLLAVPSLSPTMPTYLPRDVRALCVDGEKAPLPENRLQMNLNRLDVSYPGRRYQFGCPTSNPLVLGLVAVVELGILSPAVFIDGEKFLLALLCLVVGIVSAKVWFQFKIFAIVKRWPEVGVGIWLGWALSFFLYSISHGFGGGNHLAILNGLSFGFGIVTMLLWLNMKRFWASNPGVVLTRTLDHSDIFEIASMGNMPDPKIFCQTCMIRRPLRSKHCRKLGFCIDRFDHFCFWINRPIGFGNHRVFFTFLVIHMLTLVLYVLLFLSMVLRNYRRGSNARECPTLSVFISVNFVEILFLAWSLLVLVGQAVLLSAQIKDITTNLTINERVNHYKYRSQQSPPFAFLYPFQPKQNRITGIVFFCLPSPSFLVNAAATVGL